MYLGIQSIIVKWEVWKSSRAQQKPHVYAEAGTRAMEGAHAAAAVTAE